MKFLLIGWAPGVLTALVPLWWITWPDDPEDEEPP
jgi:hypothetical protein